MIFFFLALMMGAVTVGAASYKGPAPKMAAETQSSGKAKAKETAQKDPAPADESAAKDDDATAEPEAPMSMPGDEGNHGGHTGGGSDADTGHDTAGDEDHDGGHGGAMPVHGGHAGHGGTGGGGHDHGMSTDDGHAGHVDPGPAPVLSDGDDVDAHVAALLARPDSHAHHDHAGKATEHMAALDLVPRDEATHIAIRDGAWDDPDTWYTGEVPGDDARVLIAEGVHVTYDHVDDARLFTLRVDGHLEFAGDTDSRMLVDTIVTTPGSTLSIGSADAPVDPDVDVDIIFANNGAIDTDWDPMLLSRGMVAHGKVEIHGAAKSAHEKVSEDPEAGDTWVDFAEAPEGWQVGDTIVIAGTHYDGYWQWEGHLAFEPSQDEVRTITQIEGGRVFFDDPLEHDHLSPRADLSTSVANYTRNVSFETEDAETAETFERGHVMFMHNDDVDVHFAEFHQLGRTDKNEDARNVDEFDDIASDSNVKGRYAFHLHRAGVEDQGDPAIVEGNAVFGSPGWGFVHHDSNAILDGNATFDTFGAGYVAESGNETGAWTNNIAIYAKGESWFDPKIGGNDEGNFDLGRTGDGFWFQGRMVESVDNIAASVNNGFVYFHRGPFGDDGQIKFDAALSDISGALKHDPVLLPDQHPILGFSGNETFASNRGLYVLKGNAMQGHDINSVLEDFTAWNIVVGADLSYTAHYTLKDFDLIGREPQDPSGGADTGIVIGPNTSNLTIVDTTVENFETGMNLWKVFTAGDFGDDAHKYTIINPTFIDVTESFENFDPALDQVLDHADLPNLAPDIKLTAPLDFSGESDTPWYINIQGTKTDSLGETGYPDDTDGYSIGHFAVKEILEKEGFYTTSDGQNYFMLDLYMSDRVTGEIFVETHPVMIGDDVPLQSEWYMYKDVPFNGVRDLGGPEDTTSDAATLWATLTDGQPVLTDTALEMLEEEHDPVEAM